MGELINNNSRNTALRKGFAYSMKKSSAMERSTSSTGD
jgi:hypothetical protein